MINIVVMGGPVLGVLIIRALLFGVYIRVPGEPVAHNYGLLRTNSCLLGGIVAYSLSRHGCLLGTVSEKT